MLFLHNLPARLVAVPAQGPRPVDPWTVARVPCPGPRGPGPGGRGPWPAILDPVAVVRAPWTGRAGGYLVRA
jgi:hypothetical protein